MRKPCTIWTILLIIPNICYSQLSPIGYGWAKNSVNAPVFRKNSVASWNNTQYTSYYDSTGQVVIAKRLLNSEKWEVVRTRFNGNAADAHCAISIIVDGDGFLHLSWGHHNNPLHYCKSIAPGSLQLTDTLPMTGNLEKDVTYPEFYRLPNGNLIFIYRTGLSGSGNLVMNRYSVATRKWNRLHNVLIDGEKKRNAYWQACIDNKGTIHLSWIWRETWDVATNHDMCYARSTNGGVSWEKSNAEKYSLPINASTAEYISKISQNSELINQTSMTTDRNGNPFIASYWKDAGDSIPQYRLIYFNSIDKKWIIVKASNRSTAFSLKGGGTKKIPISRPQILVNDSKDTTIVYIIYRDIERNNQVSINYSKDRDFNTWQTFDLTDFSVNSWEPSYDTDLWQKEKRLSLFVQNMGQGDGEKLENLKAQPVYILELPNIK